MGQDFTRVPPNGIHTVSVTTADGARLEGWTTYSKELFPHPEYVALIFHGNGETIHSGNFLPFFRKQNVPAFSFDYRGYGNSSGWPSEKDLFGDAQEIWKYVASTTGLPSSRLIILGNSVGSGVASSLAQSVSPHALFLLAAYSSLPDVVHGHPIYSFFSWALRYELPVAKALSTTRCDFLVIAHGERDEVIPFSHFKTILDSASTNSIQQIVSLPSHEATHNNIFYSVENELDTILGKIVNSSPNEVTLNLPS